MVQQVNFGLEKLKRFVPFGRLSDAQLGTLLSKINMGRLGKGRVLFKEGNQDLQSVYILSGEVTLYTDNKLIQTIEAGSEAAKFPVANSQPRKYTAVAEQDIEFFRLDSRFVDRINEKANNNYSVNEIEESHSDDWMVNMLNSPVFQELPQENIPQIMMRFEPVKVRKGDTVIRQGDEGDFYYFIQEGECLVIRRDKQTNKDIQLAVLKSGGTFGEESLVSDKKRGSTVEMKTDGLLFRLSKDDFVELIKNSVLSYVSFGQAKKMVREEAAVWLDVRSPEEHEANGFAEGLNIPTYALRYQLDKLDPSLKYISYCDDGAKSSSAAFLAQERGFDFVVVRRGIAAHSDSPVVISKINSDAAEADEDELSIVEITKNELDDLQEKVEASDKRLSQAKEKEKEAFNEKVNLQNEVEMLVSEKTATNDELEEKVLSLEQEVITVRQDHENEYYTWQKEKDLFKRELDSARKKLAASKRAGSKENADNESQSDEIEQLNLMINSLEEALFEAQQQEKDELVASLDETRKLKDKFTDEKSDHEKDRQEALKNVAEFEANLQKVQQEKDEYLQKSESLQNEIENTASALAAANNSLDEKQKEIEALNLSVNEKQADGETAMQSLESRLIELEKENQALNQDSEGQKNHFEEERQKHEESMQALTSDNAELKSRTDEIEQTKQDEISQLKTQLDSHSQQESDWQNEKSALQAQLESRQAEKDSLEKIKSQFEEEVWLLKEAAANSDSETSAINNDLNGKLLALQDDFERVKNELATSLSMLEQQESDWNNEKTALQSSHESAMQGVVSDNAELKSQVDETEQAKQNEISQLKTQLDSLGQQESDWQNEKSVLQTQVENQQAEKDSIEKDRGQLEEQIRQLKEMASNSDSETAAINNDLNSQLSALQADVERMTNELSTSENMLEQQESDWNDEKTELQSRIDKALGEGESFEKERIQLQETIQNLENLANENGAEADQANADLAEKLSTTVKDLGIVKGALDATKLALKNQETKSKKEKTELQTQIDSYSGEKHQLDQLKKELSELKNSSSQFDTKTAEISEELNKKLSMTLVDLEKAKNELDVYHTDVGELSEDGRVDADGVLAKMVPEEVSALEKELEIVREQSSVELSELMEQSNKWQEKYEKSVKQIDEMKSYVDQTKKDHKNATGAIDTHEAELLLEKQESFSLRNDLDNAQRALQHAKSEKEKMEVAFLQEKHQHQELERDIQDKTSRGEFFAGNAQSRNLRKKNSNVFYLFVGVLFGLAFINFVLLLEGNPDLFSRITTVIGELLPKVEKIKTDEDLFAPDTKKTESDSVEVDEVDVNYSSIIKEVKPVSGASEAVEETKPETVPSALKVESKPTPTPTPEPASKVETKPAPTPILEESIRKAVSKVETKTPLVDAKSELKLEVEAEKAEAILKQAVPALKSELLKED
jgi:CRP-like cAMP-binding protein/chromosome segregation ATPase